MKDRLSESKDYSQPDSRANLFYFLQRMSSMAEARRHESGLDSPISAEQIKLGQSQDRIAL